MTKKTYWTTQEQLEGASEYLRTRDDEFRAKPYEDMEEGGGVTASRRGVIKATGAAAVFAGAVGCNPEKKLVPYFNNPEEQIPGNPVYYASLDARGENALVVKTTEGRPIRVDGNGDFPINAGKLDAAGNASIIDLYDPDRLREPMLKGAEGFKAVASDEITSVLRAKLKSAGSKAVLVTRTVHGPANEALVASVLSKFPGLRHVQVSGHLGVASAMDAQKACYGQRVLPFYAYDKAQLIVSLGFDILAESPNGVEANRLLANARRYRDDGTMGRLVTFEPTLSSTGAAGDERHRVAPQALQPIALALAAELVKLGAQAPVGLSLTVVAGQVEEQWGLEKGVIAGLAKQLWANKGQSLVVTGGSAVEAEGGELLLAAMNLLNTLLENDGKTVQYGEGRLKSFEESEADLSGLLAEAHAGRIDVLVTVDVNLAYWLPKQADFKGALSKIATKVGLLTHANETGLMMDAILPLDHYLESWNDGEPRQGLFVLGQPTIETLWTTKPRQQYLMDIAGLKGSWADFIKTTWSTSVHSSATFAADFANFWSGALRKGFVDLGSSLRSKALPVRSFRASALAAPAPKAIKGKQLVTYRTILHGDGDSMNNAWLLEIPDPVSKICWDNYLAVNVKAAKAEGLSEGEIVTVKTSAGQIDVPVHVQPGLADGVVSLALGWGRGPEAGQVAAGPSGEGVGVNAQDILPVVNGKTQLSGVPVSYAKTGSATKLACTQGHQYLENDLIRASGEGHRKILQDAFLEQINDEGDDSWTIAAHHHAPSDISLWRQKFNDSTSHKWAMSIDTNVCTGCSACMVSCQAENNISVVGKDEVLINREMHWIRIDRYYTAVNDENPESADDVDVVNQPMLCQHCDNAPCETVCPVIATSHNEEGLNVQTYNRCVGTRYCSNNCPYKVRHYNWYDYKDYRAGLHQSGRPLTRFLRQIGVGETLGLGKKPEDKTEYPLMLQFNPDVTVRSRGVMEKCSFCVHKIRRWHQDERALGRDLPETSKQTACQQACPADAITFGNMLDESSQVSQNLEKKGAYRVLDELNTKSNVTYLTRIRNRDMPEHAKPAHDSHGGGHDDHSSEPAHH